MRREFAKSGHPVFRCPSPLPRGVLKRKGGGKVSIHCSAETNSAEMLIKTIYRALLTWYLERRGEGDNVSPNTNLNFFTKNW